MLGHKRSCLRQTECCTQRSFRCAKNEVALRANCILVILSEVELRSSARHSRAGSQNATRAKNGKQADLRGNYTSKSAIMHKIAGTAKNRILRGFGDRRFCGKNGGKNRKKRLTLASIHHANKSPPHKHEKTPPCIQIAQKCRFRLIFGRFPADLCTQKHPFPPQQIIVIHCEYPQTPCAPMGLSFA